MQSHSWFLDERLFAGEEHLDPDYVSTYDEKAATNPADDLQQLLEHGLNTSHTLVDMGTGTGTFALAAASHCQQVIAVDVSDVMLERLQDKIKRGNIDNVKVVHGGFLSYTHQDNGVDFVYSRHALHHLSDFWKAIALKRIADMLKPGGIFFLRDLIYSCSLDEVETVIGAWLDNAPTDPSAGWTRAELVTHVQTEYSPYSWLLEPMLSQAGFEIRQVDHHASQLFSVYVCAKI